MIEALKLALVIEEFDKNDESIPMELLKPIAATLRAIAELESQEPVCPECKAEVLYECVACSRNNYPPQRTWVGLTDEQIRYAINAWFSYDSKDRTDFQKRMRTAIEAAHGIGGEQ